jgi:hypothetical protein
MGLEEFVEERLQAGSRALHSETLAFTERILLARVLQHTGGNQSQAARILRITRGTLRTKIRELGITIRQAVNVETDASVPFGILHHGVNGHVPAAHPAAHPSAPLKEGEQP